MIRHVLVVAASVERLDALNLVRVDGGRVLAKVFEAVCEARWNFKKTRDVPALVDWLIANDPDALLPLGQWLQSLMGMAGSRAATTVN